MLNNRNSKFTYSSKVRGMSLRLSPVA